MTQDSDSPAPNSAAPDFDHVPVRPRHDGWLPDKQVDFIQALGETGCVVESCRRVGMSTESAYALRRRIDAHSFRMAWDTALDYAIRRMSDAAYSRAIHGIPVPHFYQGEQIGEHRRYDERLTMFLLRYRDPLRYAKTLDEFIFKGNQESFAVKLHRRLDAVADDAWREHFGLPPELPTKRRPDDGDGDDFGPYVP